jgi:hypothetical protein
LKSILALIFLIKKKYKNILDIIDVYKFISINKQFLQYRPKTSIVLNSHNTTSRYVNLIWWKYAFTSYAEYKWRSFRPERIFKHWNNYKLYLKQYEQKLRSIYMNQEIKTDEAKRLEALENELLFESILDARAICKERIKVIINYHKINPITLDKIYHFKLIG